MEFKCRLKVILWEKEVMQKDFAKTIGISPTSLSAIVQGKSLPGFVTAYKICEALDMTIQEIWVEI